jgi:arginine decarboxylase
MLDLHEMAQDKDDRVGDSQAVPSSWTVENSEELYRIQQWGHPYFSINAAGHITVSPQGDRGGSLDLYNLVESLHQRNIGFPLLLRFPDILADRLQRLSACMDKAIARYNYPNVYRGVYPIKCNQHRQIVESLVRCGKPYHFGLEAGSKPELIIALASLEPASNSENQSPALLICNGYKDQEYIETALLSSRLGYRTIVVIEQLAELDVALKISRQLGIEPVLGVRAKLASRGMGRWGSSTGDRAKFGLTVPEILAMVNRLQKEEMLNSLQLLHFHIGSQIPAIAAIKEAIRETSQIYVQLVKLGANMKYLDVGGGLAVDYDGSKTNFAASKNYNMQNYANDIVAEVKQTCEGAGIAVPILISESGRAIAAHQSVLIFDVLGTNDVPGTLPSLLDEEEHSIIRYLWETYDSINESNYQEAYHDAIQLKEEAVDLFKLGHLSLQERGKSEQLYWACLRIILHITRVQDYVPDDLEDLEKILASIYYINLSVFQSAPDSWAIDQLFPIMPIHRLDEEPTERGTLADITCDDHGKIDQFIDLRDVKSVLELHSLKEVGEKETDSEAQEPYYLGMFLVGAYQEIMGSLHNLFGDVNVVHIQMNSSGYEIESVVKGDTCAEMLGYVQYDAEDLLENMRLRTEKALQEKQITIQEAQVLLQDYERSLRRYTYAVNS